MLLERRYDCEDCGRPTVRRRHSTDAKICLDCGLERSRTAALSMAAKSGDHYAAWSASRGPAGRPRVE